MIVSDDTESRIRKTGDHGRFDLVKSSAVQVKHTRTSNNNGAFGSFVNKYERAQEISQVYFQFLFCLCVSQGPLHIQLESIPLLWILL